MIRGRFARRISLLLVLSSVFCFDASAQIHADRLFRPADVSSVTSSPSGRWVVASVNNDGTYGLLAQRIGSGKVATVLRSQHRVSSVRWLGDHTLLIDQPGWGSRVTTLTEFDGEISVEHERLRAPGWLVDSLPLVEGEMLWEFERDDVNSVHRVTLEELKEFTRTRNPRAPIKVGQEVARIKGSARSWIVDADGIPRAALREDDDGYTILVRDSVEAEWREVYSYLNSERDKVIYPHSFNPDNRALIVAAYHGQDTLGLYEFDVSTGQITKEILLRPDVDIIGVVFDFARRELIAGVYEVGGERKYHYLAGYADRYLSQIHEQLRGGNVEVVSSNKDRSRLVLWASGPRNPGAHYYHDANTGELIEIAKAYQDLDPKGLVDVESFRVTSRDGLSVEAFLALPKKIPSGGAPLVVIPHGGPVGVRDSRDFDPLLQYLTSWGFAVLNVNYRGSSGYGLRFEEAGHQQWAKGIEDDIDAATENAMARPEVDGSRICIAGGSYGGFSALASIVRHKSRYRCAITINGATDIPLLFDTSDFADVKEILPELKKRIGDVEGNRQALMDASPLYHVDQMETPVLIIYGTRDRRVDPEHSHRLMLIMNLFEKDYEAVELRGAGHSPDYREWRSIAKQLRRFLEKHLKLDQSEKVGILDPDSSELLPEARVLP